MEDYLSKVLVGLTFGNDLCSLKLSSMCTADLLCPICQFSDPCGWGEKNGFKIFRCRRCTHIFADIRSVAIDYANPHQLLSRMTHDALKDDLAYYEQLCRGEMKGAHTHITAQLILDDIRQRQPARLGSWLDVGSGSGYLVLRLKEFGLHPIGLEPGGWGPISARDKQIEVIQGILTKRTFNQRFDFISATDVLEHQTDPLAFIQLIEHYLAPDGLAYISLPFADSFRASVLKEKWNMVAPPNHCQFFTLKSFSLLLKAAGFSLESFRRYNSSGLSGVWRIGLSLRVANQIANALRIGDQALFIISKGSAKISAAD
ncbi:MAG: Methyltransferase type 11 [Verrucomicrobiales bacterium]|nr:Methyltransferase type 11 [Verrucomicrobiales bacterium]